MRHYFAREEEAGFVDEQSVSLNGLFETRIKPSLYSPIGSVLGCVNVKWNKGHAFWLRGAFCLTRQRKTCPPVILHGGQVFRCPMVEFRVDGV
jgi:hypothetical protein